MRWQGEATMSSLATILLTNFVVAFALFVALWLVGLWRRDPSHVDAFWALGMVVLAWVTLAQVGDATPRRLLLVGLCSIWGVRLGGYLLWRVHKHGADRRYVKIMAKAQSDRGWGFAKATFILVFALQAPLLWVVSLPVQLGQIDAAPLAIGTLGWIGAALAVVGILFETIGDAQLVRFKADPANNGQVMDKGLWRYTRHPNYFGDACTWWGLFLVAAETVPGMWSVAGPLLLTYLLTKWSGVPTVEGKLKRSRPGYADYVRRTSGFVPMPPKP